MVAFLTDVAERVGPASRWVHYGLTSSDVLDTGLALAIRRAGDLLLGEQAALTATLRELALRHADTLCVGRTHGVHAEPTTFGLKLAGHAMESRRNEERLAEASASRPWASSRAPSAPTRCSTPSSRPRCCVELGIGGEPVATQVVARDRHAQLVAAMAVAASSLDRLATELRHLQRTELREAEEAFARRPEGQLGDAPQAQPDHGRAHLGPGRVVRGHAVAALEDVALWHERDISHSSVERVILPDAFLALDYMLARARTLLEGLVVRPERMREVLESSHGLVYSQRVLLGLVERGLTREAAYALVQRNAMRAWDEGRPAGRAAGGRPGGGRGDVRPRSCRRCSTPPGTPGTCPR